MPLTTAPGSDLSDRSPPPVLGVLQEPPFARAGLAARIGAEIKTGFSYGFETNDPDDQVGILDSRKEIGPDPRLSYDALPERHALAVGLTVEGPIGLTFDNPTGPAPVFPNSMILLSPKVIAEKPSASLEEHFLGVSLRRYVDPNWLLDLADAKMHDAERCWWIEFAAGLRAGTRLLGFAVAGGPAASLVSLAPEDASTITAATDPIDKGGSRAG